MPTIDWSKYVDAIYCIHALSYNDRKEECDQELDYMDILHSPIFKYHNTFQNAFDYIVLDHYKPAFRDFNNYRLNLVLNIFMAYHAIFRESQELGYSKILIIEDDTKFVRDKELWLNTLEHLPPKWDFIQFDMIMNKECNSRLETLKKGEWFHSNYTGGYWGTAFAMWSRKAINMGVRLQEQSFIVSDYLLVNRDDPMLDSLNRFVPANQLMWQKCQPKHYHELIY